MEVRAGLAPGTSVPSRCLGRQSARGGSPCAVWAFPWQRQFCDSLSLQPPVVANQRQFPSSAIHGGNSAAASIFSRSRQRQLGTYQMMEAYGFARFVGYQEVSHSACSSHSGRHFEVDYPALRCNLEIPAVLVTNGRKAAKTQEATVKKQGGPSAWSYAAVPY
ncbi:hypothetical protein UY3_17850 [Chelonia mydas]|uniref:Uncharacterized protein n=1 Tax=Chelonia mydas TaxID=8469 RepID=M7AL34_CHEMY|nr:hypothetical protein UY3_17850 [Chelonia mydas]